MYTVFVCAVVCLIPAFIFEQPSLSSILAAWAPILYAGVLSCGVGYTLQIIGQKGMNPTIASLILSLESAISVLAGWLILGQTLSARELTGCAIVFLAIVLAQLPWPPTKILKKGILWTEHLLTPSRLKKVTCAQISFIAPWLFLSPFDAASQKHGTSSYKWHAKPHKHTSS